MGEWICVRDSFPRKGECVLIVYDDRGDGHSPMYVAYRHENGEFFVAGHQVTCPSHWMRLPAPPAEQLGIGHVSVSALQGIGWGGE